MRISDWSSDVCSSDLENPSRDTLEESFLVSRSLGKPIAMFVDQSDEESTNAGVDAGVSAYIVDGFKKERIKPILDLAVRRFQARSEEHTSELQSLMRISYAVFCLKKKTRQKRRIHIRIRSRAL